jgi:hypothetical protein
MSGAVIRPAFSTWPYLNRRLRDALAGLTDEQLASVPGPGKWPIWATAGHLACQRVFWLCDVAGEPGAEASPFPNAGFDCPGDDDLDHPWSGPRLADALDRTFAIVDRVLDTWTIDRLDEVIRRPEWGDDWVHRRGAVVQRVFAHDAWHCSELNGALEAAGLPGIDPWTGAMTPLED